MLTRALDLACNVAHALDISPPNYVRSIIGDPESWCTRTCPHTELQLAEFHEWTKGLPALVHMLVPALPWRPPGVALPFSDLLFRPSVVFHYPARATAPNRTPHQKWFFINGICTDRSVVRLNAAYLHGLFKRPLTVVHNFTRGFVPDLAACAAGKEWDRVTESAGVAFPAIYAALKDACCERLILVAHSQGTILSAVVLALLEELHPPTRKHFATKEEVAPERAVARRLAERWNFAAGIRAAETGAEPTELPTFPWPVHGYRHPEPVTPQELRKLEIYCFANCASEMLPIKLPRDNRIQVPWIESYGNEMDIVARLGVLARLKGPGSVRISGDRYQRTGAWGHLLNAHYLHQIDTAPRSKDPGRGLVSLNGNVFKTPRLVGYLGGKSPTPLPRVA